MDLFPLTSRWDASQGILACLYAVIYMYVVSYYFGIQTVAREVVRAWRGVNLIYNEYLLHVEHYDIIIQRKK